MTRRRKVLVVDDDEAIRLVAEVALTRVGGFDVRLAADGLAALAEIDRDPPDAVLLDVVMPHRDGPATLAALRSHPAAATLPVVLLTASLQPERIAELRALDVRGLIGKPFDALRLATELRALLGWGEA